MATSGAQPYNMPGGEPSPASHTNEPINLTDDEKAVLSELLEAERAKLLVEIRHTDSRSYKQGLRQRLDIVEKLISRCCQA
ncbi:MAG: hypothetical protein ACUVXB_09425 [Bryobacteraceae bacterium]